MNYNPDQLQNIFGYSNQEEKTTNLMNTMDSINKKYSKGTIKLTSEGNQKSWAMRRQFKSPNYTGDWNELPQIQ